jgi:hypothetical protein
LALVDFLLSLSFSLFVASSVSMRWLRGVLLPAFRYHSRLLSITLPTSKRLGSFVLFCRCGLGWALPERSSRNLPIQGWLKYHTLIFLDFKSWGQGPLLVAWAKMSLASEQESRAYEEEHVHSVYQQIAAHFSSTRYKVSHIGICLEIFAHYDSRGRL